MRLSPAAWIVIGLLVGIGVGLWAHAVGAGADAIAWFDVPSKIFLNLVKAIVAPLIFTMIVVGIAANPDLRGLGRMGLRTFLYFMAVTSIALVVGLVAVNLVKPGAGVVLPTATDAAVDTIAKNAAEMTPQQHLIRAVPRSFFEAAANNDVLPLVVFSIMFAISVLLIRERGRPIVQFCESVADAMFVFTGMVMKLAPLAVAAAMAVTIGKSGPGVLKNLALLVGTLYGALAVFLGAVLLPIVLWARLPLRPLVAAIRGPALLAFTTSSSESALPLALENMQRFGVPRRIVTLVLPLGYSFNLDGSTLYLSLASVFVAQAAGVDLSIGEQLVLAVTLILSSKGIAAVPRASLVVLAGTLASFKLPIEGITLILGVDVLMDMARTATNVIGNCVACGIVARWEGELGAAVPAGAPAPPVAADEPAAKH